MSGDGGDGDRGTSREDAADSVAAGSPERPQRSGGPPPGDPRQQLWDGVRRALYALPNLFKTGLRINGVRATDLHTLNGSLGASIEQSVVEVLNDLRDIWDPVDERGVRSFQDATFVRQSQNWPDVLLTTNVPGAAPLMGIELKGWFVLAKEGEPSFRYKVNPEVCCEMDMLAVFPWHLDEVLSGTPRLLPPFIEEARYAALMRNYYWEHARQGGGDVSVTPAGSRTPYPKHGAKFLDVPKYDAGGNFGRVSRAGIMGDFIAELFQRQLAGIPVRAWQTFFKAFRETADLSALTTAVRIRQRQIRSHAVVTDEDEMARFLSSVLEHIEHITGSPAGSTSDAIPGAGIKVSLSVPVAELKKRLDAQVGSVAIIAIRSGSMTLAARGPSGTVLSKLMSLTGTTARIDLVVEEDGLMTIKSVKQA